MSERVVKTTLASYRDVDGVLRYALQGETVTVHADDVKRFDEVNGAPPEDKPAPKRRPRTPRA